MPASRSISRRIVATAVLLTVSGVARVGGKPITIYAPFALMGALDGIAESYRRATGFPVRIVYGLGSVLTGMLGSGSDADVLFTADPMVMEHAIQSGAVRSRSKVNLLTSRLVLVRPRFGPGRDPIVGNGMQLSDFLGKDGKLAMCDPQVAEGRAGMASLRAMNLWDGWPPELCSREPCRMPCRSSPVATPSSALFSIPTPSRTLESKRSASSRKAVTPILYSFALTPAASPAAATFGEYLKGKDAAARFRDLGYTILGQPS